MRKTTRDRVGSTPSIDIRACKKLGVFVPGTILEYQGPNFTITADLRLGHEQEIKFWNGERTVLLPIAIRPMRLGDSRYYFLDEQGKRSEILYLRGGAFVSRAAAGLIYESQSMHTGNRLWSGATISKKSSKARFA